MSDVTAAFCTNSGSVIRSLDSLVAHLLKHPHANYFNKLFSYRALLCMMFVPQARQGSRGNLVVEQVLVLVLVLVLS